METKIFEAFLENDDLEMLECAEHESTRNYSELEILDEFKGIESKNQEYRELMKNMKDICDYNFEKIKILDKELKSNLADSKKCKNLGDIKKAHQKSISYVKDYNEWLKNKTNNMDFKWAEFKKKSGSFNNKYSEELLRDKKELKSYLSKLYNDICDIADRWLLHGKDVYFKSLQDSITNLYKIDDVYAAKLAQQYQANIDFFQKEVNATINDIKFIANQLNTNIENTIIYKVLKLVP